MLIYRPTLIPDLARTSEIWRSEVQRAGFPDLYLCWVESWGVPPGSQGPKPFGLDASVGFMPVLGGELHPALETLRGHRVLDYQSAAESAIELLDCPWKRFPSVMVGWDNTARRARRVPPSTTAPPRAATSSGSGSRPTRSPGVRSEENYLFILAWNEWAEGNHLEPDQRYGRAFLEATRSVLLDDAPVLAADPHSAPQHPTTSTAEPSATGAEQPDRSTLDELACQSRSSARPTRSCPRVGTWSISRNCRSRPTQDTSLLRSRH